MSEEKDANELNVPDSTSEADGKKLSAQTAREAPFANEGRLKNGRFGKGFSGNLGGRPKKMERAWSQRQVDLDLLREGNRLVSVHVDGKIQKITMRELMFRALTTQAVKGNLKAFQLAWDALNDAQSGHQLRNPGTFQWLEVCELEAEHPRIGTKEQFQHVLNSWKKKTRR